METDVEHQQNESQIDERRKGERRSGSGTRVGKGRRVWNRRTTTVRVDVERRMSDRRSGTVQRSGDERRCRVRRQGEQHVA